MKHKYSKLLMGLLATSLCLGAVGCGSDNQKQQAMVHLNYSTGLDESGNYNDELYSMNTNDLSGADPGCFWLSEEEDPLYGGYFYMYPTSSVINSASALNGDYFEENNVSAIAARCYRSKDMYHWESCGALEGGYTLQVDEEDWCDSNFWAPEVIRNHADGKYYMYFSASAKANYGVEGISNSSEAFDRLYLGVAVSDSPTGPFDILYDTDAATGKRVPTINFHTGCKTEYNWAAIDVSPFFDDNGDLYLYFNKHRDDHYSQLNGIFGMKMKSMSIPDYSTVTCLTQAGKVTAYNTPGKIEIEDISSGDEYFVAEGGVNEGPIMLKHNGKYYLTYSSNGYESISYSVHQAISDTPLGTFQKLMPAQGNPVLDGSTLGYMNGTAHHAIAQKGNELWIIYHRHDSIFGYGSGWGRSICADRLNFVTNAEGEEVLTANGPSKSLQWRSESASGYVNLAQSAEVSISRGSGIQHLTDEILPFYTVTQDAVLKSVIGEKEREEDTVITLKWDEPVSVSSLMIYNAKDVNYAFSKVADVRFKLAEQPEWASKKYDYAVIKDLEHPDRYYNKESKEYISCSPAVAEFEEMLITEIQITISAEDRLVREDKHGNKNTALNLSEIVVLGGVGTNE